MALNIERINTTKCIMIITFPNINSEERNNKNINIFEEDRIKRNLSGEERISSRLEKIIPINIDMQTVTIYLTEWYNNNNIYLKNKDISGENVTANHKSI